MDVNTLERLGVVRLVATAFSERHPKPPDGRFSQLWVLGDRRFPSFAGSGIIAAGGESRKCNRSAHRVSRCPERAVDWPRPR